MPTEANQEEIDATYRAIGRFIVAYSEVEAALRHLLGIELRLRTDLFDPILTHDFALLCTAVLNIFQKTVDRKVLYETLKRLVKKCRELNDLRVKVVHGDWGFEKEGAVLSHVSRRNLQSARLVQMRDLLEKKADEARAISQALDDFFDTHLAEKQAARNRRKKMAAIGKLFG